MKDTQTFSVIVHFPYAQITLSDVPAARARSIEDRVALGSPFRLWDSDDRWFMVNPSLVTYVETKVQKPF